MADFLKSIGPCGIFIICIGIACIIGAFSASGKGKK